LDVQKTLDDIFDRLKRSEISRRDYFDQINSIAASLPPHALAKFRHRRDERSLGRFALGLYDNTVRERLLFEACWPHFGGAGEAFEDLGLDNEGRLVVDGGWRNRLLDFKVTGPSGSYPVEVKYAPSQAFLTFKVADLVNYLDTKDARLLVVATPSYMVGGNGDPDVEVEMSLPRGTWFMLLDRHGIDRILRYGEYGTHKGFGGKPTVRIYNRQYPKIQNPTLV